MAWIQTIKYSDASGRLKKIYDRIAGTGGYIDNVLSIHSLRPHTLAGHMSLYKNVLHHSNNTLPKWYLEAIGVYVSHLNACDYCFDHHFAGMSRLLKDDQRSARIREAIVLDMLEVGFDELRVQGCKYAKKLTLHADRIEKKDIDILRKTGFTEGEILEINQVTSYFNYVNRTVLGLGVTTKGDILGLSPNDSDDPDSWQHT